MYDGGPLNLYYIFELQIKHAHSAKNLHSSLTVVRLALVRTWLSTSLSPAPSVYRAYKPKIFLAKLTPAEGHVSLV